MIQQVILYRVLFSAPDQKPYFLHVMMSKLMWICDARMCDECVKKFCLSLGSSGNWKGRGSWKSGSEKRRNEGKSDLFFLKMTKPSEKRWWRVLPRLPLPAPAIIHNHRATNLATLMDIPKSCQVCTPMSILKIDPPKPYVIARVPPVLRVICNSTSVCLATQHRMRSLKSDQPHKEGYA